LQYFISNIETSSSDYSIILKRDYPSSSQPPQLPAVRLSMKYQQGKALDASYKVNRRWGHGDHATSAIKP